MRCTDIQYVVVVTVYFVDSVLCLQYLSLVVTVYFVDGVLCLQYMSLLDETPCYMGGKDNLWRKLTLNGKKGYFVAEIISFCS